MYGSSSYELSGTSIGSYAYMNKYRSMTLSATQKQDASDTSATLGAVSLQIPTADTEGRHQRYPKPKG